MKISTLGRHFREGSKNVFRNGWMSFASASAIAISLFILGVFLLLALNVGHMTEEIEGQVEIRVFLDVVVDQEQRNQLQNEIGAIPEVTKVTFISKEEGMLQLRDKLGEVVEGLDGDNNPLPDSFAVEVQDPKQVAEISDKIMQMNEGKEIPPVTDVKYGEGMVEKLFMVTNTIRWVGIILVVGLAFTAMFLIANTIKLTILSRRKEISIMKLVGATNSFIRWPFFIEGALLGFIGSLIPVLLLLYGYNQLFNYIQQDTGLLYISLIPSSEIVYSVGGLLMAIGIIIGVWGSTLSVRKYLKV
ncbi:permease-like cell division protein FtsX [Marinicrinis sediminis]|uniref:Cell division protein FtsX n=1 Tax=Marinicrinis sediminis TaxID=1652465 RepID=A0ABW5RAH9_9BACL